MDYDAIVKKVDPLPWCALATTGRVGTSLFQSLLDSHPEIFVFNGELFFANFWQRSVVVAHGGEIDAGDLTHEFIGLHLKSLHSQYDFAENKAALGKDKNQSVTIDTETFLEYVVGLHRSRPVTSRSFLQSVYVAYALCLGQDIARKKIFVHNLHHIHAMGGFLEDFPGSKAIALTRDPRASYVSGVENWRKFNPVAKHPAYPLQIFQRTVNDASEMKNYAVDFRALRLEDLGNEDMLRVVSDWLGVSFDPCMRQSTWAGLRWRGDRVSQNRPQEDETGFSASMIKNNWETILSFNDRMLIDYLLEDRLTWYGYNHAAAKGPLRALLMLLAILVPTAYERRAFSPPYQVSCLLKGQLRLFAGIYYHYLRRVAYYYALYRRKHFSPRFELQYFRLADGPGRDDGEGAQGR